jgi:hypothetical protein
MVRQPANHAHCFVVVNLIAHTKWDMKKRANEWPMECKWKYAPFPVQKCCCLLLAPRKRRRLRKELNNETTLATAGDGHASVADQLRISTCVLVTRYFMYELSVFIRCTDFIDNFGRRYALTAFNPPHDRVADGLLPALRRWVFHCLLIH